MTKKCLEENSFSKKIKIRTPIKKNYKKLKRMKSMKTASHRLFQNICITGILVLLLGIVTGISKAEDTKKGDEVLLQNIVSGTVVDAETGEAIPGVSITIAGLGSGTITNKDGYFELDVQRLVALRSGIDPEEAAISFSFIGYRGERVALKGQTEFEIFLEPEPVGSNYNQPPRDEQYKKQNRDRIAGIEDGMPEGAIHYFKSYLNHYPEDLEAIYGLAVAYAYQEKIPEAMQYVRMAVEHGLPVERFLAGPRNLIGSLLESAAFNEYIKGRYERLIHGPMLGKVTDSGASVWMRTILQANVEVKVFEEGKRDQAKRFTGRTAESRDFTGIVDLTNLKANTIYHYEVYIDGSRYFRNGTFRTYPEAGSSLRATIGFGGGAGYTPWFEQLWDTLRTHKFDAFFHMGDNVYIDHPKHPETQRYTYYRRQSRPEFRRFISGTSNYAIWDDHDFTINDGDGSPHVENPAWKKQVWELFSQQWNNPNYGGGEEQPGVWFDVTMGDIDMFFLDGRYYRENTEVYDSPSMLGDAQKQWLKEKLQASGATFKLIVTPVPFAEGAKPGSNDTWDGFPQEREELFSFIEEHRIEGVVLVAADRHRSDAWKINRRDGYDLYELMSSKLTNWHTHGVMDKSLFGYNQKNSFGVLSIDTTRDDPQLIYSIYNIENELIHQLTLYRSQLGF